MEAFFEALKKLIAEMEEEERRAAREGLTEEELAIFDLLTKPEPKLTKAQEVEVKKVARELLEKLQDQLAVDALAAEATDARGGPFRAPSGSHSTSCQRSLIRRTSGMRRSRPYGSLSTTGPPTCEQPLRWVTEPADLSPSPSQATTEVAH